MEKNSKVIIGSSFKWSLEINGCKDYPLEWKVASLGHREVKSGPLNDNLDFKTDGLIVKKGKDDFRILVSNDGNDFAEFNLDEVVYDNPSLRDRLREMLRMGSCDLKILVPR